MIRNDVARRARWACALGLILLTPNASSAREDAADKPLVVLTPPAENTSPSKDGAAQATTTETAPASTDDSESATAPSTTEAAAAATTTPASDASTSTELPAPAKKNPDLGVPGEVPAAEVWSRFLARGQYTRATAAFDVVNDVHAEDGGIDEAGCRANALTLEAATRAAPVSLAVWDAAYRCAQALGDDALAEKRLAAFTALARHAFASVGKYNREVPIRVLSELDASALVRASGQEVLYAYYDVTWGERYLPLRVVLWDAEEKRERWLSFDYLDTLMTLRRDDPNTEFPIFRNAFSEALLKTLARNDDSAGAAALAVIEARKGDKIDDRLRILESAAANGNFAAAQAMASSCFLLPPKICGTRGVDALLPFAEQRNAAASLLLAVAYFNGRGVKRDEDAAWTLIQHADRRLGDRLGLVIFSGLNRSVGGREQLPDAWRAQLEQAAAEGHHTASTLIVAEMLGRAKGKSLGEPYETWLKGAAEAGVPSAEGMYALKLLERGKEFEADIWMLRAARDQSTVAQFMVARRKERSEFTAKDDHDAWYWYTRAAHGGSVPSMLHLAAHFAREPAPKGDKHRYQGWLQSAAAGGSLEAALDLAALWASGDPDLDGGPKEAARIFRGTAEQYDNAQARRGLALLLMDGLGVDRDPVEAKRLLLTDAERGDLDSQSLLGYSITSGQLDGTAAEGVKWLEKAARKGHVDARNELALLLFNGRGIKADPKRARRLWEELVFPRDGGPADRLAANNYAWSLCTPRDDRLLDFKHGLAATERLMADNPDPDPGYLDTAAACHAAAGDFKQAIELQKRAIAKDPAAEAAPPAKPTPYIEHLRAFEAGQRVRE